ncbi:MAG: carbohydrate binding domain-containing protein, partial [Clostridia bacterium]|nr:carbohydrate binding domain-containing protein [Clostridia bacterium]
MKKALSLVLALLMLMSLCITPVMAAEPEGSESNPYYVANPMAAPGFITIPANSAVYYQYNAAVFNGWEVGGYGLTSIIVDGVVYDTPDMWGEIYAPLNFNMMSPGIVAYVNDTAEDVQVMISHNEPLGTENNPDTMEDGENAFSIPANNPSYVVDYVPTANGEYTFSTEQSEDFIISIDIDGTAYTLDGSLTLELESYIPVRFYISPIGVTGDIVLTVTPPKAGTEGNPHWLEVDTLYEINGTEPTYFQVDGSLSGNELLIESFNGTELTITLDGVEYITKGGALYVPLETENWVMNLVISQTSSAKNTVYFSVEYAEGTEQNPIKLVGGDNEISIPEGVEGYYYAYTVEKDGLLVATPAAVDGISYLSMANADYSSYAYLDEGASSMMMPVTAGEVITFECYPLTDEETWVALGVDTVLNIAVKNLALFSNFDSGELPEGWKLTTGGLSGVSDDISNSGFYSLKLEGDAYAEILYTAPVAQIEGVTYTVEFDVNAITSGGINFQVKRCPGDDPTKGGNLMNEYIDVIGGEWQHYTYTFDADILPDRDHFSLLFVVVDGTDFYLDNVSVTYTEKSGDPSFDGYIYNGDFETGKVEPWDNLWGSCPTVEIISGGKDSDYALHVVSGQWLHVRQTGIAVEPNTDYKITAWAKDAKDMSLLVKDGGDTKDLKNAGVNAGAEWTQFTAEFNTGDYTTIIFSLMGSTADAYGTFDNIVIEKIEGGDDPVDPPVDENLGENIFAGGDFTDGANDWNLDSGGSTIVAEDGVGHIDFNADWGYAMKGTSVSSNTDYRLSFRAKAINGSGMNVNFKNGSWADCGIDSYKGSIAADWTEYTYDFNSGDNNYLLLFFQSGHYGSDDFQVWIDDIRVQEILATDPGDDPTIDPPVAPVVPENAIVNDNFDDGETQGWSSSSTIAVVDGVLEFQCTQNWANIYKYVNAMKPNTDYVYRFNARANMKQTMNIKVNNNWAGDTGKG